MATLNMFWYGKGLQHFQQGDIDWENDTINVALFTGTFAPDQGNDEFYSNLTNEVAGSSEGYTQGGKTITNCTLTYDAAGIHVTLDGDNVSWDPSTITAQYAVVYKTGTAGTDDYVIGYGDAGGEESSDSAEFRVEWNTDGIFRTTATAQ